MTKDECILKLLAIEPETRDQIIRVTGWPVPETLAVLDKLVSERRVTYGAGPYNTPGGRRYYPRPEA